MKTSGKRKAGNLKSICLSLVLGGAALLLGAKPAAATQLVNGNISVPSDLATITAGTTNSVLGTTIDVPANTDIGIWTSFQGASATTSNVITGFNVTTDGTNFTTVPPLTTTNTANGSTVVTGYTVFTKQQLQGVKQLRWGYSSTLSVATVTNLPARYGYFY